MSNAISPAAPTHIAGDLVAVIGNSPGHQLAVVLEVRMSDSVPSVPLYYLGWPSGWDLAALESEIRAATDTDVDNHPDAYLAVLSSKYGADFTHLAAA